jgi:RsiW-degrading membrane proteinase PrsW (M82 family)
MRGAGLDTGGGAEGTVVLPVGSGAACVFADGFALGAGAAVTTGAVVCFFAIGGLVAGRLTVLVVGLTADLPGGCVLIDPLPRPFFAIPLIMRPFGGKWQFADSPAPAKGVDPFSRRGNIVPVVKSADSGEVQHAMPILVTCNDCGRTLRARDEQAGKRCRCPGCGIILIVPVPAPPTPVTPVAPIPAEPVELDYAGTTSPHKADPVVLGGARPIPVIARPTKDIAKLDKSWRGNIWWLLLLAMIPLAFVTLQTRPTVRERIERTLAKNPATTQPNFGPEEEGYPYFDDAVQSLPGGKLEGALLSRRSVFPLLFALLSAGGFVLAITYAIPSSTNRPGAVIASGLFTGTLGVLMLIFLQSSRLICCIPLFYLAAIHPNAPFGASLIGFVFGIGVCEEVIKCLPILWMLWRGTLLNWRDAAIIGMASGAGFGISEGLLYSFRYYNGVEPGDIYIVRFVSSVALHTLLSGACAIMIQRKQEHLVEDMDPLNWIMTLMAIILVPIFLHGLFDTLAKKHLEAGSLAVAVGSFIWLAFLIRAARRREESIAIALPAGPKIMRTAKGTRWIGPAE